jgi:ammonia channel protein AmtB
VGVLATLMWSVSLSFIIIKLVQAVFGLRVSVETDELGIDAKKRGYNM